MEYGSPPEPVDEGAIRAWVGRHHKGFGFNKGSEKGQKAWDKITKNVKNKLEREGIEVGTVEHPMPVQNPFGGVVFRPFLRPAMMNVKPQIKDIVKQAIAEGKA